MKNTTIAATAIAALAAGVATKNVCDFCGEAWKAEFSTTARQYGTRVHAAPMRFCAWDDYDGDGWSNWAECRSRTDPTREYAETEFGDRVDEHPVPSVDALVVYNGSTEVKSGAKIVLRAYQTLPEEGKPDAKWSVFIANGASTSGAASSSTSGAASSSTSDAASSSTSRSGVFGRTARAVLTYALGGGRVVPRSVRVSLRDPATYSTKLRGPMEPSETGWCEILRDRFAGVGAAKSTLRSAVLSDGAADFGEIDYDGGVLTVDFARLGEFLYRCELSSSETAYSYGWKPPSADDNYERLAVSNCYVRIEWETATPTSEHTWRFNATRADAGHLHGGAATFEAFIDLNGDGVWTPGEPYGVATDVDVGWSKAAFTVELTETTPQMFRIDLASAMANNSFESQKTLNDRGMWSSLDDSTRAVRDRYVGVSMPAGTETSVRIRLVRSALNNYDSRLLSSGKTYYADGVVLDITKNPTVNPLLTERDLLQTGQLDLDWGAFADVASNLAVAYAYVTNASYRVVVGNGACSISDSSTNINNLATAFVNRYEVGVLGAQTRCVPVNVNSTVYGARPTFSWVHTNLINKVYPAFRLRVWKSDGTTLVYDSGDRKAPPRDTDGIYSWAPPIYAGMVTPQGVVFATTNNYKWSVSMLDAKFHTPNQSEIKADFRLECSGVGGGVSDYGSIEATVKYMGPGKTSFSPSALAGLVHVQAFKSPDFSGEPAAEGFLQDGTVMTSQTNNVVNCALIGLPMGTYYVRAYIDSNGNNTFDEWESWGYAMTTDADGTPYVPLAVSVPSGDGDGGTNALCVVEVMDQDTDGDGIPDIQEYDKNGNLTTYGPADAE